MQRCSLLSKTLIVLPSPKSLVVSSHDIIAMKRAFRKYHRTLALIVSLPLALTVLTGMAATVVREWPISTGLSSNLLLRIHTGEVFHLQAIYPILNGLGLIGLLVTGLSMSSLFGSQTQKTTKN